MLEEAFGSTQEVAIHQLWLIWKKNHIPCLQNMNNKNFVFIVLIFYSGDIIQILQKVSSDLKVIKYIDVFAPLFRADFTT